MKKCKKCTYSSRKKKNTSPKIKRNRIRKNFKFNRHTLTYIPQKFSPHNTTQYLIKNHSSPFHLDEDEDNSFDLDLNLNPILSLDSRNIIFSSIFQEGLDLTNLISGNELASTAAQSQEIQDIKLCLE